MKIDVKKDLNQTPWWRKRIPFRYLVISLAFIIILSGVSLYSTYYGMRLYQSGTAGSINYKMHDLLVTRIAFVGNWFEGLFASNEEFQIDLKFEDLQRLRYHRTESIKMGVVSPEGKGDDVTARLTYKGKKYKIKLSLTGYTLRHVADPQKWSFRIKLKGDKAILGMQEFNLLYPTARGYLSDWIGHKIQEREGLIAMRLDYVSVVLNGKDLGLYCLEEGYDKLLIENNRRKEGIVFKWASQPDIYNSKDIAKNPVLVENEKVLRRMVHSFNAGDIGIEEVFDLPKMARFFAMNDLLNGYHHGISLSNTRYYLNPMTNRVEPISREWLVTTNKYKGGQEEMALAVEYLKDAYFFNRFFYNHGFMELYISELERMSEPKYLDNFFRDLKPEMEEMMKKIYKDNPFYSYPKQYLYEYQEYIRSKIYPDRTVVAYLSENDSSQVNISIRNLGCLPVNIEQVAIEDDQNLIDNSQVYLEGLNESLSEYELEKSPGALFHKTLTLKIPDSLSSGEKTSRFIVLYSIPGIDSVYRSEVLPWNYEERNVSVNSLLDYSHLSSFNFVTVDNVKREIFFDQKEIVLSEDLIIPPGYRVYMLEKTHVDLRNSSCIISYSPVRFQGSGEYPVEITSSDSTGQGIYVLNTQEESILQHVRFANLLNPVKKDWTLSGAVTFYQADVSVDQCEFRSNLRGDDFLNIVDSKFRMTNSTFLNINSDAFDCDFCEGEIMDTDFVGTGNDALDISGSRITISGIYIEGAGDKALSAGENSRLEGIDIKVVKSEIAVSSKDLSEIILNELRLDQNRIGLNAFQKKPEFGPGTIIVRGIELKNSELPYLIETNSICRVDDKLISSTRDDVKDILYGVEYGKSSK